MKTTSKIMVAASLIGFCSLGTHAANFSPASESVHFSLESAAACIERSRNEPTEMNGFALTYEQALQVLTAAHEQYWYDQITMADLVQRYEDGICTIEKVSEGYQVNGGGGLGIITVLDSF